MKIDIASEMLLALRNGVDTYTPFIDGVDLETECGEPGITTRNLDKIVGAQGKDRVVLDFFLQNGHVLVIFANGESYLATGFGYGHEQEQVSQFAAFAHKRGFGEYAPLFKMLAGLDADFRGRMPEVPKDFPWLAEGTEADNDAE